MTKTALLHIGSPKTGSTSIQHVLQQARVRLAPICYPLWQQIPNHNALRLLYYPHSELVGRMRQSYPADDRYFRQARNDCRRTYFTELRSAEGAIISAEGLYGFAAPEVARLRADLELSGYDEFHVVVYIRDPADFYLSITQQYLKWSGDEARPDYQPVLDPAAFTYDFRRALDTWEQVFPGSLIVRSFPNAPGFDVVSDFTGVLKDCMGVLLPQLPTRMNATLSAEAMQILQDYRTAFWPTSRDATADTRRLVEILGESFSGISQTKPVLKPDIAEQIRANHSIDVEYARSRYGLDLNVGNSMPENVAVPRVDPYRVDEIVEHVDRDIVTKLLLRVANSELTRTPKSSITLRILRRGNLALPPRLRPRRIVGKLRTAL